MATYKKRGYKPKSKAEGRASDRDQSTTAEVFSTLDESASRTEQWVAKNQKYILGVIGVIAVCILGYLGYVQFVQNPKEASANMEFYFPQQYFNQAVNSTVEKDSLFNLALNGAEGKYGLLDIIDEYKGTSAANLAEYSAGMAYLNLQQYDAAIEHLENYSGSDMITGALAKGGIGDAFMQLGQPNEALEYYEMAIDHDDNNYTTPRFLFKAGITALELGDNSKALTYFSRIKDDFSATSEAQDIEAYIGMAKTSN